MKADEFRTVRTAHPFRTFTIHVAGGRSFRIAHRNFVSQSPAGRTIIVYHADDSFSILDLALVTELDVEPEPQSTEPDA